MDIASLSGITSEYHNNAIQNKEQVNTKDNSFGGALKSAMELLNETSNLQNKAEEAEIQFALGNATSTHDLQAAQEKATIALSYTVAVRDRMLEAYKEIMNMQI